MKITGIRPLALTYEGRNYLFVKVETDEGIDGLGEFGLTFQESAGMGALHHLEPDLLGRDPFDIEPIWQTLLRRDFFPGGKTTLAAISAIDIALWDIKGKALAQPVFRLLGGRCRDRVPVYRALEDGPPERMAEEALRLVGEGWRYLRLGVPDRQGVLDPSNAVRDAVAAVRTIREAVGADAELILDAHTRLDPPEAIRLARQVEPFDLFFLEDPLRSENPQSYRRLRERCAVPLGVGEQYAGKWEFRQMIEEELADYARIDLCLAGGITEARKIAASCETHYIKIVPHNPLGPVSAAACLHFATALDNFAVQEAGRCLPGFMSDLFPDGINSEPGWWLPDDRPGLGVELNEDALTKYPFREGNCPTLRRPDGSFTNW